MLKGIQSLIGSATGRGPTNSNPGRRSNSDTPEGDPMEKAIYVDGLRKTFEDGNETVTAVDDISFTVDSGEVVGILGPNGAGKTTTIKALLGLVYPDTGDVFINGFDVYTESTKAHHRVDAMLEGARNDYWRLTVRENLHYFATINDRNGRPAPERYEAIIDQFDLSEKMDTPVRDLSRGMKQKVSLASVLAGDSSVVFLDEPTLGLDLESSLKLRDELTTLVNEQKLTIILSSHDMSVVEDICDRILILQEGRIIADKSLEAYLETADTDSYRLSVRETDDDFISSLQSEFTITDIERMDARTQFELTADSSEFYRLASFLDRHRVTLQSVETVQPDLGEIFLDMTGDATDDREREELTDGLQSGGDAY